MPGKPRRAPGVLAAVRRDLAKLPADLRDCTEAASAIQLAKTIDAGTQVAASTKQLSVLMTQLRTRAKAAVPTPAPAPTAEESAKGAVIGDLTARIADRRRSSAG